MRNKLRVAKAREINHSVENDLRGLGDTSLFQDLAPEPTLTVSRSTLSFADLANKLNLAEQGEANGLGHINIVCTKEGLSHKEKAINLFAFALNLRVIANVDCALWEKSRLHETLVAATNASHKQHTREEPFPRQVTLSAAVQLHLQQAGFAIQAQEQNQVLTDHQIRDLYRDLLSAKAGKTHSRKVG
jgi:hypothetical protein